MPSDDDLSKLNAIVGEAILGMAEANPAPETIGAFANNYRQKVAQLLGLSPAPPEAPDLQQLITESVTAALADAGIGVRRQRRPVKFQVVVAGKRTSVTIPQATVTKMVDVHGSRRKARALVQELAKDAPRNVGNRSAWVNEQILQRLDPGRHAPADQATRH